MEPITFRPLYMERVWGGRELERIYGRQLPTKNLPYGESWELVDREHEQSVVDEGTFSGWTLHQLWNENRREWFGDGYDALERFPLLIKVLDAREDLSIQVHPPLTLAAAMGGEAKTEMWYIADCDPGATLYVGLKRGVTQTEFEQAIHSGTVAECVHALKPHAGQSIFIPSGRLHAIGAGFLIHEIQQNSDTTYRVFDWNRLGLDGKPRQLHIDESLASIDFSDIEPEMDTPEGDLLAACDFFETRQQSLHAGEEISNPDDRFSIVSVVAGSLQAGNRTFAAGRFLLLPRGVRGVRATQDSQILQVTAPRF